MSRVYMAKPEVLAGKVPKTFKLWPTNVLWYLVGGHNTWICDEHVEPDVGPYCIKFAHEWDWFWVGKGIWRLKSPINIRTEMPGTGHMLTYVELKSMYRLGWGTWVLQNGRRLSIYGDETEVWRVEGAKIVQRKDGFPPDAENPNKYSIKVDVSPYSKLDVELWASNEVFTGYLETHYANVLLTVEYVPETPPEPATVKVYVYNRQTGSAIIGAYVALLSGNKIVASGYTGSDGWVTLHNIPAGVEGVSYTLLVTAGGFHEYKDSVDVVPGENMFRVALAPVPAPPIPWEWVVGGIAAVVIGGVVIATMRRRAPPVVVVKE